MVLLLKSEFNVLLFPYLCLIIPFTIEENKTWVVFMVTFWLSKCMEKVLQNLTCGRNSPNKHCTQPSNLFWSPRSSDQQIFGKLDLRAINIDLHLGLDSLENNLFWSPCLSDLHQIFSKSSTSPKAKTLTLTLTLTLTITMTLNMTCWRITYSEAPACLIFTKFSENLIWLPGTITITLIYALTLTLTMTFNLTCWRITNSEAPACLIFTKFLGNLIWLPGTMTITLI